MSTRLGRRLSQLILGASLAAQVLLTAAAGDVAGATPSYRFDLSTPADFVAQTNFVQCVGASMQMMLNIIRSTDDHSAATQLSLENLARRLSPRRQDAVERKGASVVGWAAGLTTAGGGAYRLVGLGSLQEAMKTAATAIMETGRPVGLLVWRGRHAWVMSGFEAAANPLSAGNFLVTRAIVLDPLYPYGSSVWGPSPSPRQALTVAAVGRQFVPRGQGPGAGAPDTGTPGTPGRGSPAPDAFSSPGTSSLSGLTGRYVLVLPWDPIPVRGLRIQ